MVKGFDLVEAQTKMPGHGETYNLPPVLTVDEVADFLRVNRKTVFASIADGDMPGRRVGKRIVILRDALLEWLRSKSCVQPPRRKK